MIVLPLHTERLVVRMLREPDVGAFVTYRNDPAIGEHQDWPMPYLESAGLQMAQGQAELDGPVDNEWVQLAVEHDGAVVGDVGVHLLAGGRTAFVGYTLAAASQGKGFATEAVGAVVDALFADGVHRFTATVDPANAPSMRVLEALGFVYEGRSRQSADVRGEWLDDDRYGLVADDRIAWRNRSNTTPAHVELVEITPDDAYLWGRLRTHHSQEEFVATMALTFRDALFPEVVDGAPAVPWMRGVLGDGERVGFVMIAEVTPHHPEPFLWRLLVDRWHQRRGIGTRILSELCAHLRDLGHTTLLTSWHEGPGGPRPFYERLGFVPTGRLVDDETEARLSL